MKDKWVNQFGVSRLVEAILSRRVFGKLSGEEREELRRDVDLVRRLVAEQRVPRIAVVGPAEVPISGLVETILGDGLEGDASVKEKLGRRRWYPYESQRGTLRLLDLRLDDEDSVASLRAISRERPDVILFLWTPGDSKLVDLLEEVVTRCEASWARTPGVVAALVEKDVGDFSPGEAESDLRRRLVASKVPNDGFDVVLERDERDMIERVVRRAPEQVRVRLAHLTWVSEVKREVAQSVVRAASGIAGAVASVPIPVADILPLTGLQMGMVASIAHISGRSLKLRHAWEFAVASGANVGLGYALRHLARTAVRLVPVAGSVVSAGIASSATYAIGRTAIGYFIDGEERKRGKGSQRKREYEIER